MRRRWQFRLRSIFYATAIAAVLCLLLPPLVRSVQHFLAAKRPTQPPRLVEIRIADPPELVESPIADAAPSDASVPTDALFIQTTIIRVNGKRLDAAGRPQAEFSSGEQAAAPSDGPATPPTPSSTPRSE